MNFLKNRLINILSISLLGLYFLYLLLGAFVKGGRWTLNEQIAFSQRLIDGVNSYANGFTDLFFPSSPYFPGVGYLSYIYSLVGFDDIYVNQFIMLITAVLIGLIYCLLLQKLTFKLYPTISKKVIFVFTVLLFSTCFRFYFSYMKEFKPDTVLLLIGLISFFLLCKNKKPSLINLLTVALLLFIGSFFKQSSFLIFFLVGISILNNLVFNIKEKILIIFLYSLVGLLALYFIFSTENLYYATIFTIGKHLFLSADEIFFILASSLVYNIIVCISILYFFLKRFKYLSLRSTETTYLVFSILWFIFSIISATKEGGNRGNVEVALVVFIPFVIFALNDFFKKYFQKKSFSFLVISILIVGLIGYAFKISVITNIFLKKLNNDQESISFLNNEFLGKSVFVDGDTYILAKASGLNIITEAETVGHFGNNPNYASNLKNALDNKVFDLFFLLNTDLSYFKDTDIKAKIDKNYKIYINENMPLQLNSKILILK